MGEGAWTKGTAAIESPRRAAELRRAGVDGGARARWTGGGGRYFRYRPPLGSPRAVGSNICGSDLALAAVSGTVVQVSAGAGAGARRGATALLVPELVARSRTQKIEARRNASGFKKTRGSSREGDDGQAAGFGGDARVRRQAPGRRLRRRTLGADDAGKQVSTSASSSRTDGDLVLTELALSLL